MIRFEVQILMILSSSLPPPVVLLNNHSPLNSVRESGTKGDPLNHSAAREPNTIQEAGNGRDLALWLVVASHLSR